ncbi:hypothetical protein CYLTODRAFT_460626, partial [Cylindrobasidium torrendii FP15055 ss-10]
KRSSSPDYLCVRKHSSSPDYLRFKPTSVSLGHTVDNASTPRAPSSPATLSAPSSHVSATPIRRDAKPFRRLFSLSPADSPQAGALHRSPVSPTRGGIARPLPALYYVSDSEDSRDDRSGV